MSNSKFRPQPWIREDDLNTVGFHQHGYLHPKRTAILLMTTLFWNSIVTCAWLSIFGIFPGSEALEFRDLVHMLAMTIPFTFMGLIALLNFLVAVLEPIRKTSLRIDGHEIVKQTTWSFLKTKQRWDLAQFDGCGVDIIDRFVWGKLLRLHEKIEFDEQQYQVVLFRDDVPVPIVSPMTEDAANEISLIIQHKMYYQ